VGSRAIDYAQDLLDAPTAAGLIKRAEVDAGVRESATTGEAQHTKHLEREVKELRRANEILSWRALFCAQPEPGRRVGPEEVRRQASPHLWWSSRPAKYSR
jgi:hypothetical protein